MTLHSESFNKADAATLGPDLTWTEVLGTVWGVTGNAATVQAAGSADGHARAEHDVASVAHYVECPISAISGGSGANFSVGGPMMRYSAAADTCYGFQVVKDTTGQISLTKWVAGSESAVGSNVVYDPQVNDVIRGAVRTNPDGSVMLVGYVNGVPKVQGVDASSPLTTGTRGGMRGIRVGTSTLAFDSWKIEDLDATTYTGPTFVAAGAVSKGALTTAITPALPAGIATDDILLLHLCSADGAADITIANSAGGTWAQVPDSPQRATGSNRLQVYWSRYNGTQTAPTTSVPQNHVVGVITAYRGCLATGDPWDVTAGGVDNATAVPMVIPGDTTTVNQCRVVITIVTNENSNNPGSVATDYGIIELANFSEHADDSSSVSLGGGLAVASGEKAVAGAFPVTLANCAAGAQVKSFHVIALKPAEVSADPSDAMLLLGVA